MHAQGNQTTVTYFKIYTVKLQNNLIHRVHSCSCQRKQYITSYSQLQTYSTNITHHQTFNEVSTPRLIREHMTQHTTELRNETIRLHM